MIGVGTILFGTATMLIKGLEKGNEMLNSEELVKIVIVHSAAAGVAAMPTGFLPGAGVLVASGIATGAVLSMYVRIGKYLGLKFDRHVWKPLVSAVLGNIVKNLGALAVAAVAMGFTPGVAVATNGILNFALTYISGLIFLKTLTGIFHAGETPDALTKEQIKEHFEKTANSTDIKAAFSEAKGVFKQMRKDGSLNTQAEGVDISEDAVSDEDESNEDTSIDATSENAKNSESDYIASEEGIQILILDNIENGFTKEIILGKLEKRYGLTREKAEACYEAAVRKN